MNTVSFKIEQKYEEIRKKMLHNETLEVASLALQLTILDEINTLVDQNIVDNDIMEEKIDKILDDLVNFAYHAKFEITAEDFVYTVENLV